MPSQRPDLDRIGLFTEASYISTNEPYTGKRNEHTLVSRVKGKQFQTSPNKRGHDTRDVYFDKQFIRLFENEPYTDLVVLRRRYRLHQKEKNIVTMPFKPSSVPPKPSGSGSQWGTIEQQYPLPNKGKNLELPPAPPKQKPESKPNFLTRPPKKGLDRAESKKKMVGERAFISSSARLDFFNTFAGLIGSDTKAAPKTPPKKEKGSEYQIRSSHLRPPAGGAAPPEKPPKKLVPIFRPSGISKTKSYPIRSIIEATCPIAAPKWLQEMITHVRVTFHHLS
ncbi:hypothetical protein BCR33DRAFT_714823 [Rhizoclosmatium globosum]|uniref:Cilia-and flagella-associated protein 96 n=1 Tax=Rhizoclosmatium globosum TaxID=329046 RepID=A0A1Y2CL60_9FUNG|nr:hypothetical protein BCR33DRAFT_714823 [Rhizoclosmatium globosum]|eukprot:ORY47758.1 hypothetical protein BCR33DRAFT_714823 [Rhizoclosmatium globosum]